MAAKCRDGDDNSESLTERLFMSKSKILRFSLIFTIRYKFG